MTDERDDFARKLVGETLDKIVDGYGFGKDFNSVVTSLITDLLGFVMSERLKSSGWDKYCELITEEAKRRAEKARNLETGIRQ